MGSQSENCRFMSLYTSSLTILILYVNILMESFYLSQVASRCLTVNKSKCLSARQARGCKLRLTFISYTLAWLGGQYSDPPPHYLSLCVLHSVTVALEVSVSLQQRSFAQLDPTHPVSQTQHRLSLRLWPVLPRAKCSPVVRWCVPVTQFKK